MGLIHYDFEFDNLFWDGSQFHIIDFDDVSFYWFAADIGFALRDLWNESHPDPEKAIELFLRGYREEMPLEERWEEEIPQFAYLQEVLAFARLIHSFDGTDPAMDSPWVAELRNRCEGWLDERRQSFANC